MKIVAGVGENKNIVEAIHQVGFPVYQSDSEEEFTELISNGEVDAFVRGSLSASIIMSELKHKYDNIYRAAFLEVDGYKFFLAPVGIDEGDLLSQKLDIIKLGAELLQEMRMIPKIGVLSAGRVQDVGRSSKIDESISQGESVTRIIRNKYSIKHYHILIEDAIADHANLILAPDGISGNLIFRSLVYLGSGKSHGAVTLGIREILVDTSRSQTIEGYVRALKFAKYLAELEINKQ